MKTIDCRGQACPVPVIATKKALEESGTPLCMLVDDGAPRENVVRFVKNRGYQVTETAEADGWSLLVTGSTAAEEAPQGAVTATASGDRVLLITSNRLGDGSEELGYLLMKNFIFTLLETPQQPDRILFLNSGVLLATEGAETVEALKRLEERGIELFACGVCLDYFKKKDQLAVGQVTNMFSTAEHLLTAASVIRL
ncbi:MAG: sulfurtransferase-like selenium metabolism protein YedF [Trichlorobacter sp.]|uniref:sulfurtransferase-like selenium metabolism protein YedF n=1 Tax=Trichlorobacter sp. TaxID=2911007 RepID=UPI00256D1E45|nr:sulfurtransferase-like selenium metabolism protein YedF [Trichlorobacter sp.]MDK9717748.1 sulfurtransferase-like selenium metabolism protein YedF [Trichlorobacter sp.]